MATKYEVDMLKDQIRRLISVNDARYEMYCDTMARVHDSQEEVRTLRATVDGLEWQIDELRRLCADMFKKSGPTRGIFAQRVVQLGVMDASLVRDYYEIEVSDA